MEIWIKLVETTLVAVPGSRPYLGNLTVDA
jgi:hypothetical protein